MSTSKLMSTKYLNNRRHKKICCFIILS